MLYIQWSSRKENRNETLSLHTRKGCTHRYVTSHKPRSFWYALHQNLLHVTHNRDREKERSPSAHWFELKRSNRPYPPFKTIHSEHMSKAPCIRVKSPGPVRHYHCTRTDTSIVIALWITFCRGTWASQAAHIPSEASHLGRLCRAAGVMTLNGAHETAIDSDSTCSCDLVCQEDFIIINRLFSLDNTFMHILNHRQWFPIGTGFL